MQGLALPLQFLLCFFAIANIGRYADKSQRLTGIIASVTNVRKTVPSLRRTVNSPLQEPLVASSSKISAAVVRD